MDRIAQSFKTKMVMTFEKEKVKKEQISNNNNEVKMVVYQK